MVKASEPSLARIKTEDESFNPVTYEESNVHGIYQAIASHFSETRYKPWPLIPAFLNSLPSGSTGADFGCGNGKYLAVCNTLTGKTSDSVAEPSPLDRRDIITLGVDRSENLVDLAAYNFMSENPNPSRNQKIARPDSKNRRHEVAVGDVLRSGFRSSSLDFAFSIATIHHLSTWERRRQAIEEMIRVIRPVPESLASQESSPFPSPYPGLRSGSSRFLIVVWALEQRDESRRHFDKMSANDDQKVVGDTPEASQDLLVPWVLRNKDSRPQMSEQVFQRFYHVFREGELEQLVEEAARNTRTDVEVRLEMNGWEKGNWYGVWQCINTKT